MNHPRAAAALLAALLIAPVAGALPFHDDTFTYRDAPLNGQGQWVRGLTDPASDNPSEYLVVRDGKVLFDWTATTPVNNSARIQWIEAGMTTGVIYAAFDFHMTQAPVSTAGSRPGFFSFDRSGGGQLRGHLGLRKGTAPDTFQLGVSASSQTSTNFTYVARDLAINTTYRVMVAYDAATAQTRLWIGTDDRNQPEDLLVFGTVATNIRRVQFRLSNSDGAGGVVNMGIFTIDNLVVGIDGPAPAIAFPAPSKVFLFLLAGQANMAGRGAVEDQDRVPDPRIVYLKEDLQWRLAREPLHWDRVGSNGVGPGLAFARALLPSLPADAVIGLVPVAASPSTIGEWQKDSAGGSTFFGGQYLYAHALARAREAMKVGTLAGILWNQGESDSTAAEADGGAAYRESLARLVADLRADLGRPDLPFIASTLGPFRPSAAAINATLLAVPGLVPYSRVVDTLDPALATVLTNNPADLNLAEYSSAGYRALGGLYAGATLPIVRDQLLEPRPPVVGTGVLPEGLRLAWRTLPWRSSVVQSSSQPGGAWQDVRTIEPTSTGGEVEVVDPDWQSAGQRFYRIRID